jgi:thiol-disulfide isomerase/thioredoxin
VTSSARHHQPSYDLPSAKHLSRTDGGRCCVSVGRPRPRSRTVGVDPWLNTPDGEPLGLAALRHRVVLVEFWTFACVNCQHTLQFLRRMHDRYQPDFTVVGVHSPEFAFERSVQNVERAVREHRLEYPVGLDNDFVAWNAYGNRYWPTMYLIDRAGQIRYTHIGEGNYGHTETAIRTLLAEAVGPATETRAAS